MEAVFLKLLNMSISAAWLVAVVILLRLVLKKAPKALHVGLWALVGVRLLCPFSVESVLSLIPSAETVPPEIVYAPSPTIDSGIPIINSTVNPVISGVFAPDPTASINPMQVVTAAAAWVWVLGILAMLLYTLISYLRLRYRVRESVPLCGNIRECDRVSTPFILGVFRPRVYLPSAMNETDRTYVIAHEQAHLRRRDHWWKPLGFLLLTVYWFNPVLWLAYILLCRDIELACDERVIRELGDNGKKPYAEALVNCSIKRRSIAACPLAFGETGVKARIRSVLNYKKPAFWIILVAVAASVIVAICFLTDPPSKPEEPQTYENGQVLYYTAPTDENAKPHVNAVLWLTEEELEQALSALKDQKWMSEALLDRINYAFDGRLRYNGWLYFGYEQQIALYVGEDLTESYSCTLPQELTDLLCSKNGAEAPTKKLSRVKGKFHVDGKMSVMDVDTGETIEYTVLQKSQDGSTALLTLSDAQVIGPLVLVTEGETTGLRYVFDDDCLEGDLYLCDVDGDKQNEIVVHQILDEFGLVWGRSKIFKVKGDELVKIFDSDPNRTADTAYNPGFTWQVLSNGMLRFENRDTGYRVVLDTSLAEPQDAQVYFHPFFEFVPEDINGDGVCEIRASQYVTSDMASHDGGFLGTADSLLSFDAAAGAFTAVDAVINTAYPVYESDNVVPARRAYASVLASCEQVVEAVLSPTFGEDWNNDKIHIPSPNAALAYEWSCMIVEAPHGTNTPTRRGFGYMLKDINGDGRPELFFVGSDNTVLAVFTLHNGKPRLLDAYWSRHRCYVRNEGFLYVTSSSGAEDSYSSLYWLDGATGLLAEMRRFGYKDGVPFETVHSSELPITQERLQEILKDFPDAHGDEWVRAPLFYTLGE